MDSEPVGETETIPPALPLKLREGPFGRRVALPGVVMAEIGVWSDYPLLRVTGLFDRSSRGIEEILRSLWYVSF